jgi:hypothetical protein
MGSEYSPIIGTEHTKYTPEETLTSLPLPGHKSESLIQEDVNNVSSR